MGDNKIRIYDEIDDENQIKKILEVDTNINLGETIPNDRYKVLAEYSVSSDKYRIDEFVIGVNSTNFGYDMVEIELMVDSVDIAKDAEKRIYEFVTDHNLKNTARRAKLQEYCFRKYPEKFRLYI